MKSHYSLFFLLALSTELASAQGFHPLGQGLNGPVYELMVHDTDLYVGGDFTDAGGHPDADYLARWDGSAWHAVAAGLDGPVRAILLLDDDLFVGGDFAAPASHIVRWDGAAWHPMGAGLDGPVLDLDAMGQQVYAGGSFSELIMRWDGASWETLGPGIVGIVDDPVIHAVHATDNLIYVGGNFAGAGGIQGADRLASWDGQAWQRIGTQVIHGVVADIGVGPEEEVYITGRFNVDCPWTTLGIWDGHVMKFSYAGYEECFDTGHSLVVDGDVLYVGLEQYINWEGYVTRIDLVTGAREILLGWGLGEFPAGVRIVSDGAGLYVGSQFNDLGGEHGDNIVRWRTQTTRTTENESSAGEQIRIYPSPATDRLVVERQDGGSVGQIVRVVDSQGRSVPFMQIGERMLDLEGLPAGIYCVVILGPDGQTGVSFVKQ